MSEAAPVPSDDHRASRRLFVSYATADRKQALALCKSIEKRGTDCWISTRDVAPGENYQEAIVRSIRDARAMVLVFSGAANNSDEIKKELSLASRYRVPVIALRIEDVEPSDAFAYELSTRQWIDAFEGRDKAIDALVARIGQLSADGAPASGPPASRSANPRNRTAWIIAGSLALALLVGAGIWLAVRRPSAAVVHPMQVRLAGFQLLSADLPPTIREAVNTEIIAAFNKDGVVGVSTASRPTPGRAPAFALGGTIQRDGGTIRVITRLTNERSGATLWSDTFNYPGTEASAVPRHVAVDAGNVVRCGLFGASTYRKPLPDNVLRDYLQFCQGHWDPNISEGRKALVPAQRVVAAVPDFSWGWAAVAGAYWKGDATKPQMQRIYGTAFFTQEELDAWLKQREEAEKRDHRRLGRELDLFSIQEEYGQGLVFWHPKGGAIRKEMEDYLREQLLLRGYGLVFTPHIAKRELWFTSGHEINYADSMFSPMEFEEQEFRIKPMNCPFHIGIYKSAQHSYRELPLRYAELGTCYRAELSGALHGLIRVRGFTQDDAHIFCTPETVRGEIVSCIDFALSVYEAFGFKDYKVELSVRGEDHSGFFGEDKDWESAEAALVDALNTRGIAYERIEGEAAFYGPKIDIRVKDAIGRAWQLTTVQFDFNLPQRFQLEYIGEDNKPHQPIMIHRALFGSMERFFGVLIEHFAGAFPMWLAPVQVAVLPITDRVNEYAEEVARELRVAGMRVETNLRSEKIGAKIRDAQLQKVPFMLVLGDREMEQKTVAVRERAKGDIGVMSVAEFKEMARRLVETRALTNN